MTGKVTGRDYTLPPGLALNGPQPFWVAVAYWGWVLGRPFGSQEVAVAFRVELSQARNVVAALLLKPGSVLRCTRHSAWRGGRRCRLVTVEVPPPQGAVDRRTRTRRHRGSARALADVVAEVLRQRHPPGSDGT